MQFPTEETNLKHKQFCIQCRQAHRWLSLHTSLI